MGEPEILVPISSLNQFTYCPRRCWYIHVAQEFIENVHTLEGRYAHERSDSGEVSRRGDLTQTRSVYVHSVRYGLTGRLDLIEERSGEIYPVEFKKGPRGDWGNDQVQLCAQALCLEEALGDRLAGPIARGFIYYAGTGRRQEVTFSDELRQQTLDTIEKVRELLRTGARPPAVYGAWCKGCSLYRICLPKETDRLRRMGTDRRRLFEVV